jgi:ribose transport system permease protein
MSKPTRASTTGSPEAPPTDSIDITQTGSIRVARPAPGELVNRVIRVQSFQILLVLVVIGIIFSVIAPTAFPQWSNFRTILQNVSILAVLGIGMTFVIITSGIDLSIGSVLVFSGVIASEVMKALGGQGWGVAALGIVISIGVGVAWGLLNGLIIAKAKVPPLIVTLGALGAALGLAEVITGGIDLTSVPTVLTNFIGYGNVVGTTIPIMSVIALIFLVVFGTVLHRTKFGLYTYAIGSNEQAARRVGVKVDRQLILVYGLSGAMAGVAGIMSLAQYSTTAIAGQSNTNLNVIAAVVIGGTSLFGGSGGMFGTVVGLFIPAVLQDGFVIIGVQSFWQQVAVGVVLIVAVYVDQRRRAAAARGGGKKASLMSLFIRKK